MSTNTLFDLNKLYQQYFNSKPYYVTSKDSQTATTQDVSYAVSIENPRRKGSIDYSSKSIALNKIGAYGQDIWFPVELWKSNKKDQVNSSIQIDACTIAIDLGKKLIMTPVSERQGEVIESFNTNNVIINIKGFLIGKNRFFPEDQIETLKEMWKTTDPVELHGGYPELFLDESCRIAIEKLSFPEVQGKAHWIRPFAMTCYGDFIQDLIIT